MKLKIKNKFKSHLLKPELTMAVITDIVADIYEVSGTDLRKVKKAAMYLWQDILDARLVKSPLFKF
ncbi:hypothetical protein CJF42_07880 [Pseudoalteromonas sp. NBT06-2]|uniref:hypothetical protein n=1 Tax=Pseudoalteromonas sp. NBT06-2 TaxID=2025950 RepID=UPI000BA7DCCA|nr:hypothetical protein [Pseudoalteromonas sp. NBT06-2]PAJ74984.1 hypothetical protein CJF42_07880 [Pseudoalteromonas sp. NBT06-2]